MEELRRVDEAAESFSNSIYQAVEALDELQRLSGKSCLKADFRITSLALQGLLQNTSWHIKDLKQVMREEADR